MNNIIVPQTITDKLLYSTVRIIGLSNGVETSGTGFFFHIVLEDSRRIELILTNKHVVKRCEALSFYLHEAKVENDALEPIGSSIRINMDGFSNFWIPHPDADVDLGALLFVPIREHIKNNLNKITYQISFDKTLIQTDIELKENTGVAEEVLMAGYPIGLWDEHNNFPIIRKGITATHPALDFKNKSIGVIDAACFPGSSGSPILICMQGSYANKQGGICLGTKIIFLGLLSSGPTFNSDGKIEIKEIPTEQTIVARNQQFIHLGYYVKAKEILKLCECIEEKATNA
jgi:hypothetical protein